jgi:hypothetical protein
MKTIKIQSLFHVPKNFTGIAEYSNELKQWYKEGKLHRIDGPAVEYSNGTKIWYKEGKRHRENGPAREHSNGGKEWYKEGKRHRIDGPAVEYSNGEKEWWVDGVRITGTINVTGKIFLGKEKGRYNLEWLLFLSETDIEEIPIVPGFEQTLVQYFSIEEYVSHNKRIKNENE